MPVTFVIVDPAICSHNAIGVQPIERTMIVCPVCCGHLAGLGVEPVPGPAPGQPARAHAARRVDPVPGAGPAGDPALARQRAVAKQVPPRAVAVLRPADGHGPALRVEPVPRAVPQPAGVHAPGARQMVPAPAGRLPAGEHAARAVRQVPVPAAVAEPAGRHLAALRVQPVPRAVPQPAGGQRARGARAVPRAVPGPAPAGEQRAGGGGVPQRPLRLEGALGHAPVLAQPVPRAAVAHPAGLGGVGGAVEPVPCALEALPPAGGARLAVLGPRQVRGRFGRHEGVDVLGGGCGLRFAAAFVGGRARVPCRYGGGRICRWGINELIGASLDCARCCFVSYGDACVSCA